MFAEAKQAFMLQSLSNGKQSLSRLAAYISALEVRGISSIGEIVVVETREHVKALPERTFFVGTMSQKKLLKFEAD